MPASMAGGQAVDRVDSIYLSISLSLCVCIYLYIKHICNIYISLSLYIYIYIYIHAISLYVCSGRGQGGPPHRAGPQRPGLGQART